MPNKLLPGIFSAFLIASTIIFSQNNMTIPVTSLDESGLMNLGASINSTFTEYTPFITPDETRLFFESDRPGSIGNSGNFDLWYSTNSAPSKKIPDFTLPVNAGLPLNTDGFDGHPSLRLTHEIYEIYFTSYAGSTRGGPKESNIYVSRLMGNVWSEPRAVEGINSDFHDRMPSISPDGKFLYFSSDRPGGFGKDDIWVSEYDTSSRKWNSPVNLGSTINTTDSEISPSIHVDSITLYFSSNRPGGVGSYDIYVTQKLNAGTWKNPGNLGIPYNSKQDDEYPTVTRSGESMYFASNRPGGHGGFDIYRARVPDFAKPVVIVALIGKVFEENTTKGIEANISIRGDERRFDISSGLPEGIFKADFLNNRIYELLVTAPGFEPFKYTLDLRNTHEAMVMSKDFPLKRIRELPDSYQLVLQYFDSAGQNVAARAVYRFDPSDNMVKNVKDNTIKINVPDNTPRWNSFIESNRLILMVEADGFLNRDIDLSLISIFEAQKNRQDKIIHIPVEMKRIQMDSTETGRPGLLGTIYFDTGVSDKIPDSEKSKLTDIITELRKSTGIIEIHGHTDSLGTPQRNIPLSMNRARYLRKLLISMGISEERIKTFGHSFSRPAVKETSIQDRGKNRRVEIFIKTGEGTNGN
jgi:peptidoglycan-associated lipoprotein